MKTILLLVVLLMASCVANDRPLTRQEAEMRADAGIRYGLIIKDEREAAIAKALKPDVPQVATTKAQLARLDAALIQKRAISKARASVPYSTWFRQYNEGRIDRGALSRLCAQEDAANQQRLAAKRARSNAIAAGALAGLAQYNQSQAPLPYQLPAFRPIDAGVSYDPDSLSNPYGAGSPYKANGLMNPYSPYGSQYSNKSWANPYATDAPKIVDQNGKYHGRLSTNPYDADSTSSPYGRYGSKYSPDSLNNPYGAGNPYSSTQYYVVPQR